MHTNASSATTHTEVRKFVVTESVVSGAGLSEAAMPRPSRWLIDQRSEIRDSPSTKARSIRDQRSPSHNSLIDQAFVLGDSLISERSGLCTWGISDL